MLALSEWVYGADCRSGPAMTHAAGDQAMSGERAELQRIILRLSLVSHAPVQAYDFAPSEVGRGRRWRLSDTRAPIPHLGAHSTLSADSSVPRGGIDIRGDLTQDGYRQKSHTYFVRRLRRVRTDEQLAALLKEAQDALRDWMKTPEVAGVEAERGSFLWKCMVADDTKGSDQDIWQRHSISRATLFRYRARYRGVSRSFTSTR